MKLAGYMQKQINTNQLKNPYEKQTFHNKNVASLFIPSRETSRETLRKILLSQNFITNITCNGYNSKKIKAVKTNCQLFKENV